jgi:hypothetical protein
VTLLQELTEEPLEQVICVFADEDGYQTPKVDLRAVVVRDGREILLVREKGDNDRRTLPGRWADVGYTPFEVPAKEVHGRQSSSLGPSACSPFSIRKCIRMSDELGLTLFVTRSAHRVFTMQIGELSTAIISLPSQWRMSKEVRSTVASTSHHSALATSQNPSALLASNLGRKRCCVAASYA